MIRPTSEIAQVRWLPCVNNSGSLEIPSFGLVRVVSVDTAGVLTVDRPNADSQSVMVNGPVPIPASGKGIVTWDDPVYVYYDTGDGTPALGESWGAEASSYKANKNKTGFTILGGNTSERTVAIRTTVAAAGSFSGAKVYNSGTIACASGTPTALTFDSERYDTDTYHSTSSNTGRLTVPTAGKYRVGGSIYWDSSSAGSYRMLQLWSLNLGMIGVSIGPPTTTNTSNHVATDIDVAAGDYFYFYAQQNSGGSLNVTEPSGGSVAGLISPQAWIERLDDDT